jgi:YHS domain-containing protein
MASGKIIDPVCEMIVDVTEARDQGLILEYPDREYAFCSASCQSKFAKDSKSHVPKVEAWLAREREEAEGAVGAANPHDGTAAALPEIDAGVRAWYASCRCCLSDAYPQVVEVLDRERDLGHHAPAEAGICETAEAHTDAAPHLAEQRQPSS